MIQKMTIQLNDRRYEVEVNENQVAVNGKYVDVSLLNSQISEIVSYAAGARRDQFLIDELGDEAYVIFRARECRLVIESERERLLRLASQGGRDRHHHEEIKATMPGLVVRVLGQTGREIKRGEAILILEAMKMENEIRSPVDGILKEIRVIEKQVVEKGELLAVLE